jgi:hypothetical protein
MQVLEVHVYAVGGSGASLDQPLFEERIFIETDLGEDS